MLNVEIPAGNSPTAPAPTPRPDGRSTEGLPHQGSGVGAEGDAGRPLLELVSSMRAG